MIPLFYLLDSTKPPNAPKATRPFLLFFVTAFISYLFILYWIPRVMVRYGQLSKGLSIFALIILAAFLSLFHGIAGIFIRKAAPPGCKGTAPIVLIPLIWVAKDLIIELILGGFPWCLAGYSQYKNIYFIQAAEIGGIHLVTFLLIYFNVLFYRFLRTRDKRFLLAAAVSFFAIYTVGYYLYQTQVHNERGLDTHRAGIIQPNTTNDPITEREKEEILRRLFKESAQLVREGAEFIVWPEHTVSIYPLQNQGYYQRFLRFVRSTGVPLLAGFTDLNEYKKIYNSAVLFGKDGIRKYDKVHLTPFGEYVLFREILFFVKRITDEIADFTPGAAVRNLDIGSHPVATPICYEIIFPGLVREFVARGGELIITISNDSWFGDTSAPYQHLSMAVFRGIENRRCILRSTTNGISALIEPSGVIRYRSAYNTPDTFIAPFKYIQRKTFFTYCGYLFPYLCFFFTVGYFIVVTFIRLRSKKCKSL